MARYNDGLIPASPTVVSGVTAFGTHVNPFISAVLSGFAGTTRSDDVAAGHVWSKEIAGGYELNMFVGSATDVPLGTITTATEQYALPIDVIEAGLTSSGRGAVAGDIKMHGASTAPTGWLKCNGAAVSRTTYAALFAAIGTTYGTGDGSTTFNLPDFRGEFVRGWDDGRGVDSGRAFGSAQTATAIRTAMDDYAGNDGASTSVNTFIGQSFADSDSITTTTPSGAKAGDGSAFAGASADNVALGGQNANIGSNGNWITMRPRNVATLFCIKF